MVDHKLFSLNTAAASDLNLGIFPPSKHLYLAYLAYSGDYKKNTDFIRYGPRYRKGSHDSTHFYSGGLAMGYRMERL